MKAFGAIRQRIGAWVAKSFATDFLRALDIDDVGDARAERLVRPYEQSTWVFSACQHIAGEIESQPLKFYDGDREIEDPALADWWGAPAIGPDKKPIPIGDVVKILTTWERLEGEFFIILDETWLSLQTGRGRIDRSRFIIARPDRMQLIVRSGELEGYRYTDAAGRQHLIIPEQVVHYKSPNPYDPWRGLGCLAPSRVATEADFLAGVYMRDLMYNSGDHGSLVIGKSGIVDEAQREQIVAALRAKRLAARRGQYKDLFLTGDITVEQPQAQAADANLQATRLQNRHEVYIAFGVPPSFADVKAAYSIGSDSDRNRLVTGTSQPVSTRLAGTFATLGSRQMGRVLTAEFDWDNHPVMVEVRISRLESADKLWGKGMPMREINDYLDLGLVPYKGWDKGYLPFSVAPIDALSLPDDNPGLGEEDEAGEVDEAEEDNPIASLRSALTARREQQQKQETADACPCGEGINLFELATLPVDKARDARELAQWRDLIARRLAVMRSYRSAFTRELMLARREVLQNIDKFAPPKAINTKAAAADLIFDLENWKAGLLARMHKLASATLKTAGQELFAEIGKDDPFTMPPLEALRFVRSRENRLADVADDVFARVRDTLEEGITLGESTAKLAARVKAQFNDISRGRANVIAQTETGAAYSTARQKAMENAGVQYKQWLTSGNANVRGTHRAANQQTRKTDEPFDVGGAHLMHPGDPAGPAKEVINCHCVSIAVAPPKES